MIALDRTGNEQYFSGSYNIETRPYTREEKVNMMSLFEYMLKLYKS